MHALDGVTYFASMHRGVALAPVNCTEVPDAEIVFILMIITTIFWVRKTVHAQRL
jgi:hypothetical protein